MIETIGLVIAGRVWYHDHMDGDWWWAMLLGWFLVVVVVATAVVVAAHILRRRTPATGQELLVDGSEPVR
jgi:hypothetical protein